MQAPLDNGIGKGLGTKNKKGLAPIDKRGAKGGTTRMAVMYSHEYVVGSGGLITRPGLISSTIPHFKP